jgi:hypothetical protein
MAGGARHRVLGKSGDGFVSAPTTRPGRWAVGLVAATLVLGVAVATVVPGDSLAAWVLGVSAPVLGLAGGVAACTAIFRRADRGVSVYAAALALVAGVLFVLLHSLVVGD